MPQFAILRVEKIKSFGELKGRHQHNARDTNKGVEHCDPARPPIALHQRPEADACTAWDARAKRAKLDRAGVRKGGVVALEWLATASPGFFDDKSPKQVKQWVDDTLAFIEKEAGGTNNILSAHLHLDETTPHLQVTSIPLVRKKTKDGLALRLSARDIIGGHRDRLIELQDDYHAAVAHHGLDRGIPRKETGEKNKPPSLWRREQRLAAEQATEAAQAAQRDAQAAAALKAEATADREKAARLHSRNQEVATLLAATAKAASLIKEPRVAEAIKSAQGDSR